MQSYSRTLSHTLLDNTARARLNGAHIWKTSNQYFSFLFLFSLLKKNKRNVKRRRIQNKKKKKQKKKKKKRYSVVIG